MKPGFQGRRVVAALVQIAGGFVVGSLGGMAAVKCMADDAAGVGVIAGVMLLPAVLSYGLARLAGPKSRWKDILYWSGVLAVALLFAGLAIYSRRIGTAAPFADRRYSPSMVLTMLLGAPGIITYLWLAWASKTLFNVTENRWDRLSRVTKLVLGGIAAVLTCTILAWVYILVLARPVVRVDYLAAASEMRIPEDCQPEKNGTSLYGLARELVNKEPEPDAVRRELVAEPNDEPYMRDVWIRWPADMNDVQLDTLRAWAATNEAALAKLEEAMSSRYLWLELTSEDGSLLRATGFGVLADKRLAEALRCRARLRTIDGDIAGAMRDIHAMGEMYRLSEQAPLLIEWLVGLSTSAVSRVTAREVMAHVPLSDEELVELSSRLAQTERRRCGPAATVPAERLYIMDFIQRYFTDAPFGMGRFSLGPRHDISDDEPIVTEKNTIFQRGTAYVSEGLVKIAMCFGSGDRKTILRREDKIVKQLISLSNVAPYRLRQEGVELETVAKSATGSDTLLLTRAYTLVRTIEFWQQHKNDVAGTQILIAIMRYKLNEGHLPDVLDRLADRGYLKDMPTDLFSGAPFIYRQDNSSFALYSVGKNGEDDGGERLSDDNILWPIRQ